MQPSFIELIGVYTVEEQPDVTLIELLIDKKPGEIDVGEFTQELVNEPRGNWQAAFGEKYLDISGEEVIGDDMNLPNDAKKPARLAFFMYFLDTSKPLLTPFGNLILSNKLEAPTRIKNLIVFESPE